MAKKAKKTKKKSAKTKSRAKAGEMSWLARVWTYGLLSEPRASRR